MRIVPAVLALDPLLEHPDQDLVAEVALGGLGVRVEHERVGDLEAGGHLDVHPGGAA